MARTTDLDGWTWHHADLRLVKPWFAERERLRRDCAVKGSDLRDVFRVEVNGAGYYVKYHHPDSLFQQVRSGIAPKAKREFESIRLIAKLGLPVAPAVGWGSHGSRSMLLTREVPDAVSAREHWFGEAAVRPGARKRFLRALGKLLQQLLAANLHHPDFHLGNLLVTIDRRGCKFTLIDVYGATAGEPLDDDGRFALRRIVGALRGELDRGEAIEFFRLNGLASSYRTADELWRRILTAEARQMEQLWPKRRRKILAGSPKYLDTSEVLGREWRIRRDLDGSLMISPEAAEETDWSHPGYDVRRLTAAAAEQIWLASFRLSFHRVPHPRALAWITADEGEEIVLLERLDDPVVAEGARRQELVDYLRAAGIRLPDKLGSLVIWRGHVSLRDPALAEFP